ncbi:MAG: ABC transporter substrate-binding protein [Clostridiaceae bacterium]|nr:ABC transporter substrate-binding protein [Clostridiaceae bacterium]
MKKFLALSLALILSASFLVSCGNTPSQPDNGSSTTGQPAAGTDVKYKEDIVIGISGKIISIDPQTQSNTQHNYVFRMVFDTLIDFDNKTNELKPNLATSWETQDGITYKFKLRDDVSFTNGEKLTANDVVFSFKRAPGTDSSSTLGKMMESVTADDDYSVTIKLFKANVDFPYMLTLPTASIINEKAVTDDAVDGPGVGSGPWKIDSYEFGDYVKLVRNDNYWGEKALTKTFTIRYMPDASPRLIALQTGEIDICQDPETLEIPHIESTKGLEVQSYEGSSLTYIAMNYTKAPFNNPDFRLALCYGIDVDELIAVARDGYAKKAQSLWGWNEFGYNGGKTPYEYNVEKAKEYVDKAFPNGGAKFTISVSSGERKAIAELLQSQLKKIGVEVTINEMDTAGLSTSTTNGEHEACVYGCGMNIFGDDIRRLICPGTGVNKSHYDNAKVNELMDIAVAETDETKRAESYKEVQQVLHDDGAYVPLYFAQGFFGVKEGIGGIDYYPTSHHDMSYVYFIEK